MYIFKKYICYTFKIFIHNVNYMNINIYMELNGNIFNMYGVCVCVCVCVYIYIINIHSIHTYIIMRLII